ncbi:tetratricopeptide repeat protein [Candidatus Riflebacteria bacterium]
MKKFFSFFYSFNMRIFTVLFLTALFFIQQQQAAFSLISIPDPSKIYKQEWSIFLPAQDEDPDSQSLENAIELYQKGELKKAEKLLNRLLIEYPENGNLHHYLGLIKFKQQKYLYAMIYFSESIKLNPEDILSLYNRSVVYFTLKQWEAAIKDCDTIISIKPDYIPAINTRGLCYKHMGKTEKALSEYTLVLKKQPSNFMARYNRALLNHTMERYAEAVIDIETLLKTSSYKNETLYFLRGECYLAWGKINRAKADFQEVCRFKGPYKNEALKRLKKLGN